LIANVLSTEASAAGTVIVPAEELENESSLLAEQAHFVFIDTPMAMPRPETEETNGMLLMAAVPVFGDYGDLIGIVYAGTLLNRNYAIVDEVKQTVFQGVVYEGKDIGTATIFQNDVRISTNVSNEDGSRAIGTRIAADVYEQVIVKGEQWVGRAYVVNDWYITAYEPIRNIDNEIIGVLYVGILEQKYTDINNRAVLVFSGITITGVILAIVIALLISRGISSSIKNLVTASRQLANGNLEAKASKVSDDELGELADTFNTMAVALKDRDEKLKEYAKKKIMESERLALIGQLSANVAHELNNPLQGIVTYSHLLLEEEAYSQDAKTNLQKIVVQANRCRDIIRGLLDFSRQKKPDKTLCNINALLHDCVSLIEKQALFHNIQVVWDLEESLPSVILDPSQVERVFLNLIINAAEAMDGNGKLTLITRYNRKKKNVEIKVKDTGHGITEENISKIFDPFFTTKETGHGVGLGLAISYGIVKEHKGNLYVESELEKGTTFTVSFPLTSDTGTKNGK
jgi:two-component system NtrC family sensor kinase